MKIINNIVLCILVLCIPILLISSNIWYIVNDIPVYQYIIEKYDISDVTGIDKLELKKIYQNWIDYYNSRADTPQMEVTKQNGVKINLLSAKEITHLEDVKELVQLDYYVRIIAAVILVLCSLYFIFLSKNWRLIAKGILWGSIISSGLILFLAFLSLCCFDQLFLLFHQISFTNEFWILDPARDYLIMMFPGGFFFDVALWGLGAIMLESLILAVISFWFINKFNGVANLGTTGTTTG